MRSVLNSEQNFVEEAKFEDCRRSFRRKWLNLRAPDAREACVPEEGSRHISILTRAGERTGYLELGIKAADWRAYADPVLSVEDIGSPLASGSFPIDGMVVAPCSIHSLSAIANGITGNLLVRAADVTLKERRKLVLMVRETPFHLGHLRTMAAVAEMGAIIAPPIPAFITSRRPCMDIVDHSVERVMDLLGVPARMRSAGRAQRYNPDVGRRKTVSFQGEKGAFSQVAVQQLLGTDVKCSALPDDSKTCFALSPTARSMRL